MNKQRAAKTFNHATSRTKKINTAPTPQRADSGSSSALLSPIERAPGSTWCATHVPENRTVEYETALRQMHRMQTGSFQTMAIRLMHEAQQHNKNSFITLTLNEQTLASARQKNGNQGSLYPPFRKSAGSENSATSSNREEDEPAQQDSLVKRDLQLFVKKNKKEPRQRWFGESEVLRRWRVRRKLWTAALSRGLVRRRFSMIGMYGAPQRAATPYRSPRLEKLWT